MSKKEKYTAIIAVVLAMAMGCYTWWNYCRHQMIARYPAQTAYILQLAGGNQKELVKVLEHYRKNPADSLKYKAAVFLIENMPSLKTNHSKHTDIYISECKLSIDKGVDPYLVIDSLASILPYIQPEILNDVHFITSDFLISNIDHSFYVWETQPWGKFICFSDFCEYILPYRIDNEQLDDRWREKYYQRYQPIVDSMFLSGIDNIYDVCIAVNNRLYADGWYTANMDHTNLPVLSPFQAFDLRIGTCRQRVELGMYVMRSLGIPVSTEFVQQWPTRSLRHYWNALLDSDGKRHLFVASDSNPEDQQITKRGKIYRKTFSIQPNPLIPFTDQKEPIPLFFNDNRIVDVTREYIEDAVDITIELTPDNIDLNNFAYLGVFDNRNWIPITWGFISEKRTVFKNIEKGIACLPLVFQSGQFSPAGFPFVIEENGSIRYIKPDHKNKISVKLPRKYSFIGFGSKSHEDMHGGKFQASNDINFEKDVKDMYIIEDGKKVYLYNMIDVSDSKKYRYARYYSAPGSHCNISELAFFGINDEELTGEIIGTDSLIHGKYAHKNVFDKNILTFFFTFFPDDTWIGLDFGEPKTIKKITFSPRNDDNFISSNCTYELQYYTSDGWNSLGQKLFNEPIRYNSLPPVIQFDNVPSNALFRLRNHTKGTEERIFEIDSDGNQVWW